jgi:hypothetical protein
MLANTLNHPPCMHSLLNSPTALHQRRYKGGVTATLQRRERQGGDPSLSSAAAAAAAAGGPGSDAAAAAAAAAGGDAFARWPWPSEAEVAVEAALRRPAPRVWVLVGGDGSQRQRAFRSGANVAAKLARCCDIQVCLMFAW